MKKFLTSLIGLTLSYVTLEAHGFNYVIKDLGTLTTKESCATSINNTNTIVGYFLEKRDDNDFFGTSKTERYPFVWTPSKKFSSLKHLCSDFPLVNNLNQIAYTAWIQTQYWLRKNTSHKHIFINSTNGFIKYLTPPKTWKTQELESWQSIEIWDEKDLSILAFTDKQQILFANSNTNSRQIKSAVWENDLFQEIDTKEISIPYGMNNEGIILGRKWIEENDIAIPMLVLYNPIDKTTLHVMKDVNITRRALNDQGQVIILQTKNKRTYKGFLWDPQNGLIELDDFAPYALNNSNQIVGLQISALIRGKTVPLIWTPEGIFPLNLSIGLDDIDSIWNDVISFTDMNDNGYIIGQGLIEDKRHAFVLIPE